MAVRLRRRMRRRRGRIVVGGPAGDSPAHNGSVQGSMLVRAPRCMAVLLFPLAAFKRGLAGRRTRHDRRRGKGRNGRHGKPFARRVYQGKVHPHARRASDESAQGVLYAPEIAWRVSAVYKVAFEQPRRRNDGYKRTLCALDDGADLTGQGLEFGGIVRGSKYVPMHLQCAC